MTANGFEPDYEKLWDAAFQGVYEDGDTPDLGAVIAAYEAQRAAAGYRWCKVTVELGEPRHFPDDFGEE